jgi:hypothetical protein
MMTAKWLSFSAAAFALSRPLPVLGPVSQGNNFGSEAVQEPMA